MVIYRFKSSDTSHTILLFWHVGRLYRKVQTFRALARTNSVSDAYLIPIKPRVSPRSLSSKFSNGPRRLVCCSLRLVRQWARVCDRRHGNPFFAWRWPASPAPVLHERPVRKGYWEESVMAAFRRPVRKGLIT